MHYQLMDAVKEALSHEDRAGIVTSSEQVSHLMTPDVVTAMSFTSWDDLEQLTVSKNSSNVRHLSRNIALVPTRCKL
jgi:hypothetical protein